MGSRSMVQSQGLRGRGGARCMQRANSKHLRGPDTPVACLLSLFPLLTAGADVSGGIC